MILVTDFFNKTAQAIDKKYFPTLQYYRDDKNDADVHYSIELYNNGASTYPKLIKRLAKSCKDTEANIHNIVKEFVEDFEGYEFK